MLKDLQDRLQKVSGLCDKIAATAEQGSGNAVLVNKKQHEELLDEKSYLEKEIDDYMNQGVGRKTEPDNPKERLREGTQRGAAISHNRQRVNRHDDFEAQLSRQGWAPQVLTSKQDSDNLPDGDFRDFGDYLRSIKNSQDGKYDNRLESYDNRNLTQSTVQGATGGFTIPQRFLNELFSSSDNSEPWLSKRRTFVAAPGANSLTIPTLNDDDRSNKDIAGVSLSRTGESATLATSTITFGQDTLKLSKAATRVISPNELLHDSTIGMSEMLSDVFGKALSQRQSQDFFRGTGTGGGPLGVLNGGDKFVTTSSSSAGIMTLGEMADALQHLEGTGGNPSATWLVHPGLFKALAIMLSGSASSVEPVQWFTSPRDGAPRSLLGLPIFFTPAAATIDTAGDILCTNLNQYLYLATQPTIELSSEERFSSDETVWRMVIRDAGQNWRAGSLILENSFEVASNVWLDDR